VMNLAHYLQSLHNWTVGTAASSQKGLAYFLLTGFCFDHAAQGIRGELQVERSPEDGASMSSCFSRRSDDVFPCCFCFHQCPLRNHDPLKLVISMSCNRTTYMYRKIVCCVSILCRWYLKEDIISFSLLETCHDDVLMLSHGSTHELTFKTNRSCSGANIVIKLKRTSCSKEIR
jgi:hypothetical protein